MFTVYTKSTRVYKKSHLYKQKSTNESIEKVPLGTEKSTNESTNKVTSTDEPIKSFLCVNNVY